MRAMVLHGVLALVLVSTARSAVARAEAPLPDSRSSGAYPDEPGLDLASPRLPRSLRRAASAASRSPRDVLAMTLAATLPLLAPGIVLTAFGAKGERGSGKPFWIGAAFTAIGGIVGPAIGQLYRGATEHAFVWMGVRAVLLGGALGAASHLGRLWNSSWGARWERGPAAVGLMALSLALGGSALAVGGWDIYDAWHRTERSRWHPAKGRLSIARWIQPTGRRVSGGIAAGLAL